MRIVEGLVEGTAEWRAWRHAGLGSGDAAALCGVSRQESAEKLWARKRGPIPAPQPLDFALSRGIALEPEARAAAAAALSLSLVPRCVEHDDFPVLRASLDGWSDAAALPVELKCGGAGLHAEALAGRLPRRHAPQVLHQLLVSGARRAIYASYRPEERVPARRLALVEVERDDSLCEQLARLCRAFWRAVQDGTPPGDLRVDLARMSARKLQAVVRPSSP